MPHQRVPTAVYVRELEREVSRRRSELVAAEATIRRITSESAEQVAALTARRDEAEERASAAEAKLEELR